MALSTLRAAAAGQVGFCWFSQVDTLLEDAAQSLRAVHARICNIGGGGVIRAVIKKGVWTQQGSAV